MAHARSLLLTFIAATTVILFPDAPAFAQPNPQFDGEAACDSIAYAQADAWNHVDARAIAAEFAPDGVFIARDGSEHSGRDAFADHHTALFRTVPKDRKKFVELGMMRELAPGVLLLDAVHKVTTVGEQSGADLRDDLRTVDDKLRVRYVFQQIDGRWLIVAQQETEIRDATSPKQ
jgi:uncharacterized protein (TIGR02246 family)